MNKCHFVGKLTDDPVSYSRDQTTLVRFTLAVEEFRKDKAGKKIRSVEFLDFEVWSTAAQTIFEHAIKGDCMAVEAIARNQEDQDEYSNVIFRVTNFKIFNSSNYENVTNYE